MGERAQSGSVWPVAVLFGALGASAAALGAWLAALASGATRPWFVLDWVAEHALWGIIVGALVALLLRVCAACDPSLAEAGRRRAAAARLATWCVAAAVVAMAGSMTGSRGAWARLAPQLAGSILGIGISWLVLGHCLARTWRVVDLRAVDPLRTAALLAVLTLPLAEGIRRSPDGSALPSRTTAADPDPLTLTGAWAIALAGCQHPR